MSYTHISAHNLSPATRLGLAPTIAPGASVRDSRFGRYTQVGDQVHMANCLLDDYAYVQPYCDLMSTDIGKFANIASMVRINPGFHPMDYPSLHHFTYRPTMYGMAEQDDAAFFEWRSRQRVVIGHDTWIGHGAVIMPGVRIGNGAVVGSNSVVTKDVPAYAIVGGVAAKLIRQRFPRAISEALDATAWWDWDHDTLTERLPEFKDLRSFLAKYAP
ncbi:MAG: DapH/DapD/GlmU-related protein [Rhodoferax sp.]|uniref:DapH/DapD/GlmU-related protein n=1 Tax=Rhodoferax sp. TaxID=50421 RepID=UPI0026340D7F|nr:DapH/DapD/GlmU-related protein [Rhodoferax sp.]MDD2880794.1 DapH/DapD/GlmU-related protein [Rhodoferax sp.]